MDKGTGGGGIEVSGVRGRLASEGELAVAPKPGKGAGAIPDHVGRGLIAVGVVEREEDAEWGGDL